MHNRNVLRFVLSISVLILINAHPSAAVQRVAVMPFENTTRDSTLDWLSMGIPETITNGLLALKGIVLIERLQLRKVMDEQKLQITGAIDEATVVEVGKLLGASILVVGAFQKQEQTVRLTARFVDVQSGGILQTAKATGSMNDIFDLQDQIVQTLLKNLNIEPKQDELRQLAEKPTASLEAYQHFGQGSLFEARKDYPSALQELKKAGAADPKFAAVKEKFAEIFMSLNKGNYWSYETTSRTTGSAQSTSQGTMITRAGGHEVFNGMPVFSYNAGIETHVNGQYTGKIQAGLSTYYVKKDDGIYMVGAKNEGMTNKGQVSVTLMYEPAYLVYPYNMEVGKQWMANSTIQTDISGISSKKITQKQDEKREVINREAISVPAGTFDCFVIESRSLSQDKVSGSFGGSSSTTVTTNWFAQGVGTIKMKTETKAKKVTIVTEQVLKEYHIEE